MLDAFRREWQQFHRAKPGHRFLERHQRHAMGAGLRKTIFIATGLLLIAFGLATLFIPPIPGITLVLVGALMCAQASERAARTCDRCELGIRRGWQRLRGKSP